MYSDGKEAQYKDAPCNMDPLNAVDDDKDCDGDSITNGVEKDFGSDPFDGSSKPAKGKYYKYDSNGRVLEVIRFE